MNNSCPLPNLPNPFLSSQEQRGLVLDFEKATARLVRAGIIPHASAVRLTREVYRGRRNADATREALTRLVCDVLLAVGNGILKEGVHYRRIHSDLVAIHIESLAPTLPASSLGARLEAQQMRSLFRFGFDHCREVVVATSQRVVFGDRKERRRAAILNLANAQKFVGLLIVVPSP